MDVGKIEATLTAKFDSTPFDRFDKAFSKADRDSNKKIVAHLDGKLDSSAFSRFDKEQGQAKRDAAKPIVQDLKADADTRGFREHESAQRRVQRDNTVTGNSNKKLGGSFTTLATNAKFLAGGAAIGGLALAFRSMVEGQSEVQAANAQLNSVLKSMGGAAGVTADDVDRLSTSISKKSGMDDEAIKSGAALMLTFGKVRNETGKGNDVFTKSIGLTADLSRAFGKDLQGSTIMVGKALNDPIKGVTALGRVGVQFTAQQREQIKTMVESGDQLGAQKVILANLEKQVGGSAEAYGKTLPGAIDRAKVAFGNFTEGLGGKIAPAVSAAADLLEGLFDGSLLKGKGGAMLKPIIDGFTELWAAIQPFFVQLSGAFREVFGGSSSKDMTKDLAAIVNAVGVYMEIMAAVIRRVVPGIVTTWRGLFMVIRGITKILGGLLSGDFSRVWSGLKDIVGGAVRVILGAVRSMTAPIREALSRVFAPIAGIFRSAWNSAKNVVSGAVRAVVAVVRGTVSGASAAARAVARGVTNGFDAIGKIPGTVRNWIGRAISGVSNLAGRARSAGASVGRAVINGIGSGLSQMGSFLGNVGQGIRNWINANTKFGDPIKVGPLTVNLPALAMGGRVGPSLKGAQIFVAGEGGKDEWVISQEGDRSKNIGWAVEALERLTGRKVAYHASGAKLIGKKLGAPLRKKVKALGDYSSYPQKQSDKIDQLETDYARQNRIYDLSDEEFLTSNSDGSVTVNTSQINTRLGELDKLISLRTQLKSAIDALNRWISTTMKTLSAAITKLKRALRKAKKKDRKTYSREIGKMTGAKNAMAEMVPDLTNASADSAVDLMELAGERAEVESMKSKGVAADTLPTDPTDPTVPTDPSTPTEPAPAPPSAEEIAQAAAAQVASFTASRASLFGSFGQNFIGAGGQLTAASAAAGFRMFGAGQADGGGVFGSAGGSGFADMTGGGFGSAQRAGAGGVIITNNYAAPPPDPHTWSQGLAWEIRTAV